MRTLLLWEVCPHGVSLLPWYGVWIWSDRGGNVRKTWRNECYHSHSFDHHEYLLWSYGIPRWYSGGNCPGEMRDYQVMNSRDSLWSQSYSWEYSKWKIIIDYISKWEEYSDEPPRNTSAVKCPYCLRSRGFSRYLRNDYWTGTSTCESPRSTRVSSSQSLDWLSTQWSRNAKTKGIYRVFSKR